MSSVDKGMENGECFNIAGESQLVWPCWGKKKGAVSSKEEDEHIQQNHAEVSTLRRGTLAYGGRETYQKVFIAPLLLKTVNKLSIDQVNQ